MVENAEKGPLGGVWEFQVTQAGSGVPVRTGPVSFGVSAHLGGNGAQRWVLVKMVKNDGQMSPLYIRGGGLAPV